MKFRQVFSPTSPALLIAALGVFVPIGLFLLGSQPKELSFTVVSQSTLADLSDKTLSGLAVSYQGEQFDYVESMTLRFENSGRAPIQPADFERSMTVELGPNTRIIAASLGESEPENLHPKFAVMGRAVRIEPILLNAGDRFVLTLVLAGSPGAATLDARIAGVKRVEQHDLASTGDRVKGVKLGMAGVFALLGYFYLAGLLMRRPRTRPKSVPLVDRAALILAIGIASAALLVEAARLLQLSGRDLVLGGILLAVVGAITLVRSERVSTIDAVESEQSDA